MIRMLIMLKMMNIMILFLQPTEAKCLIRYDDDDSEVMVMILNMVKILMMIMMMMMFIIMKCAQSKLG